MYLKDFIAVLFVVTDPETGRISTVMLSTV